MKKLFIYASISSELLDLLQTYKPKLDHKTLALNWSIDYGNNSSNKYKLDLTLYL